MPHHLQPCAAHARLLFLYCAHCGVVGAAVAIVGLAVVGAFVGGSLYWQRLRGAFHKQQP